MMGPQIPQPYYWDQEQAYRPPAMLMRRPNALGNLAKYGEPSKNFIDRTGPQYERLWRFLMLLHGNDGGTSLLVGPRP